MQASERMKVETLSGSVVTPTAISGERRVDSEGRPYYLGNSDELAVVAFPAGKAWRIREYLRNREEK